MALPPNLAARPVLGHISHTAATTSASPWTVSQVPPPVNTVQTDIDPNINGTDSTESFVNLNPPLAPAATVGPASKHCSSLAIANAKSTIFG
uniref:Uncharacterized protein n=1 Tax=Romanomermis culicivorax TaxID=13658 RepID=A0A915KDJ3_ROMCU